MLGLLRLGLFVGILRLLLELLLLLGILGEPVHDHDCVIGVGIGHVVKVDKVPLILVELGHTSLISFDNEEIRWLAL